MKYGLISTMSFKSFTGSLIIGLSLSLSAFGDVFSDGESFMKEFYKSKNGDLVKVMAPCDPGCYVDIDIEGLIFSSRTSGIGWERLYELEDEEDTSITLNYSLKNGLHVIHTSTKTIFNLKDMLEKHPIDFALMNCYSTPAGQTTMGMSACLSGAEKA